MLWYINCQYHDNVKKLENVKSGQIHEKKLWNLVVPKTEKHNLSSKTAIKIESEISRKKKHSFNTDNRLQVDKITRKMEAKFNKRFLLFENHLFSKIKRSLFKELK